MEKSAIREMTMKKMLNAFLPAYVMYFNQMKYPVVKCFAFGKSYSHIFHYLMLNYM